MLFRPPFNMCDVDTCGIYLPELPGRSVDEPQITCYQPAVTADRIHEYQTPA
jgi:hypothetical protein